MSLKNKTTRVSTFKGWGIKQPNESWEDCGAPQSYMDCAFTGAGRVGWTNTFTRPEVGDRVILRRVGMAGYSCLPPGAKWIMTGYA